MRCSTGRRSKYADVTSGFLLQIRMHRLNQGISRNDAARSIGMDPGQWSHLERGGRDTALNTVYAMAEAVGLRITLRPKARTLSAFPTAHHANRTSFKSTPVDESVGNATPITRRVLAKLRATRRAKGLTQKDAAHLLRIREQTLSDLERGKVEPAYGRVAAYADTLGLAVGALPAKYAGLLNMSDAELEAVSRLVVSYVNHRIRNGSPVPPGLLDAAEKLEHQERALEETAA